MRLKLRLYGRVRAEIGSREVELEVQEGARLKDLPLLLASKYGQDLTALLGPGDPLRYLRVLVNGRDHFTIEGEETRLSDGDVVSLIPPICGG